MNNKEDLIEVISLRKLLPCEKIAETKYSRSSKIATVNLIGKDGAPARKYQFTHEEFRAVKKAFTIIWDELGEKD